MRIDKGLFIKLYVKAVQKKIPQCVIIDMKKNIVSLSCYGVTMVTLIDWSTKQKSELELIVTNNIAGLEFAKMVNARLYGLTNSEVSTIFQLQNFADYQKPQIKFSKRFEYDIEKFNGF